MSQEEVQGTYCPVCCAEIQQDEKTTICPHCSMPHHQDCWNDNHGCATYGCKSSGCLKPSPMSIDVDTYESAPTLSQRFSVCPQCQTQLSAGTVFCWKCGADLGSRAVLNVTGATLTGAWKRWAAKIIGFFDGL